MKETLKRAISGAFYVIIMWLGASYEPSFRVLFTILAIVSFYEMWKLRNGKSKFLAFAYVLIPFILIQLIVTKEDQQNWNSNLALLVEHTLHACEFQRR